MVLRDLVFSHPRPPLRSLATPMAKFARHQRGDWHRLGAQRFVAGRREIPRALANGAAVSHAFLCIKLRRDNKKPRLRSRVFERLVGAAYGPFMVCGICGNGVHDEARPTAIAPTQSAPVAIRRRSAALS